MLETSIDSGPTPRNRDTAGTQAPEGLSNRIAAGRRDQNNLGAAERLQSLGGIGSSVVNVMVGTELMRQFHLVGATGNGRVSPVSTCGVRHCVRWPRANASVAPQRYSLPSRGDHR